MRRIWILALVCLLVGVACDISVPDVDLPEISVPEISMPEIDLSDISLPEFDLSLLNIFKPETIAGSGNVVEENRVMGNYREVTLSGVGDLILEQSDSEGLVVSAEDNLIQYIRTEVSQGKLIIGVQPGITLQPTQPVRYHLKINILEALNLSGSGTIEAVGVMGRRLKINMDGSGHIKILNLDANAVEVKLSGSGDVEMAGNILEQDVNISGVGNYVSPELHCGISRIRIPGSGSAYVEATNRLEVDIPGSGKVYYEGNPEIKQNISGSGELIQR